MEKGNIVLYPYFDDTLKGNNVCLKIDKRKHKSSGNLRSAGLLKDVILSITAILRNLKEGRQTLNITLRYGFP